MSVSVRLFKTYCCTIYRSQKCGNLIAKPINSVCTSWNKCVRRTLSLPHDAHTWLLGPLLKQNHIKNSLLLGLYAFYFAC